MNSVDRTQQQQVTELRHAESTQKAEVLEKTGMGNIGQNTLSVGHQTATKMTALQGATTAVVATPAEGSLDSLNKLDSSELEATLSGLRSETDDIQSKLQKEVVKKRTDEVKEHNDKLLDHMKSRLEAKKKVTNVKK